MRWDDMGRMALHPIFRANLAETCLGCGVQEPVPCRMYNTGWITTVVMTVVVMVAVDQCVGGTSERWCHYHWRTQ